MRINLHAKVYLVITFLVLALGSSIYWFSQNSLQTGLLERASQHTLQQMDTLVESAEAYYDEAKSWDAIQRHPRIWRNLRHGLPADEHPHHRPPPPRDFHGHDRRPPPRRPPPRLPPLDNGAKVLLLDLNKNILAGSRRELVDLNNLATRALQNNEGSTIGFIAIESHQQLTSALDVEFKRQQLQTFLPVLAGACLLLVMISLPLARRLTTPIIELQKKTRQLSNGNLNVRCEHNSSDEMGDLARDFNTLAKTLGKNEAMRRQWVADISHELRTPIAVIKGHIEAVQDGIRPSNADTWSTLHRKTEQLSNLINDLHQLSLSDSGDLKYHKSQFVMAEFLHDFSDTFRSAIEQSGKTFSSTVQLPETLEIYADSGRLTQLLSNLLENSIKYTDAPGTISLQASAIKKNGQCHIELSIEDSSPSVNPHEIEHLFERLYRVDNSRNRNTGGAGLGLSLCQGIVTAHNGTINATLSPLGGLKITVYFPTGTQSPCL